MPAPTPRSTKPRRKPATPRSKGAASRSAASSPGSAPAAARSTPARSIRIGDALKIERRYVVDGVLTCMTDEGRFSGVQQVGTAEHLVLEDPEKGMRMFPLPTISEITLVETGPEPETETDVSSRPPEIDPSIA